MARMWPWSSGAPAENEHTRLESEMGPDTNLETDLYNAAKPGSTIVRPPDRQQAPAK